MLDLLGQFFGGLLGRGQSSLSVPILDGAFRPNNLLEEAEIVLERPGLEDMALAPDGRLFAGAGAEVLLLESGAASVVASYDAPVTALAFLPDGRRAVALGSRILVEGRTAPLTEAAGRPFRAITALSADVRGRLLVSDASSRHGPDEWRHDLMNKGATGRAIAIDPATGKAETLQDRLQWAMGVQAAPDGVLIGESWRHRLRLAGKGDATTELPGYPARITATADGGFWLSLFAGRAQIVEFVLTEHAFRRDMMATIDPKYWISPALSSGDDFLEPLQSGGVKHMGILKPWAPPRSYGLAVRLDARRNPVMSIHSRVGGKNHGVVTTLERGSEVFALSKGAGRLLRLDLSAIRAAFAYGGSAT
jgi:hypothetical protein